MNWRLLLHSPHDRPAGDLALPYGTFHPFFGARFSTCSAPTAVEQDRRRHAAWNMAVDEALLNAMEAGKCLPTLRLYAWLHPALSLGRFQPVIHTELPSPAPPPNSTPDARHLTSNTQHPTPNTHRGAFPLEACRRIRLPVVRRPTGGRAVLHHLELTYSVVLPHDGEGIAESYRTLSEGLRRGLQRLGIGCALGQASAKEAQRHASCFAAATRSDLIAAPTPSPTMPHAPRPTLNAQRPTAQRSNDPTPSTLKLVGSAQCRRGGVLLQHGAIPLAWDRRLYREIFCCEPDAGGAGCLEDYLGRMPAWEEVAEAVAEGFRDLWGPEQERGGLTDGETEATGRLHREKYATEEWTCVVQRH
ncbi:MAG: hypothetical protein KY468_01375 [Armatimonadetes bacterium]|nr:hypothetical protein [Armatimonadota bacterium]